MNIYVGNLSRDVTEDDLRQAFEAFGQVESVNVVKDKISGESRGFGFVQMPSMNEANAAITGMNNKDLKGRNVNAAEARPKAPTRRGGGGRGGPGGGRGGDRRGGRSGDRRGGRSGGKRRY
ncbi:MAG: RNA recognition motif domain-containing protein [Planctomycetota bacterium]|jgi:RNA recognition motif-containing protein